MITILHIRVLFFFFWITLSFSQLKWNTNKDKITLPFELTHNLIIVDVVINDVDLKMILDTGSEKNILFSFPEKDSIEFYSPKIIRVRGLGYGEYLEAIVSSKNKFSIEKEFLIDENFEILLVTEHNIGLINKLGIPINGVLGSSFFKNFLVEINYSRQKIILHRNKDKIKSKINKKYRISKIDLIKNKPYINFEINNNDSVITTNLLFDTGLSDGLWLFEDDKIKCSDVYFTDFLGKGLGGDIMGKKSRVKKLKINNFELKDALVSFPDSNSVESLNLVKDRKGSIGGEILKRFNWFLDYENDFFYMKTNKFLNEPFDYNMSGIEIQHDGVDLVKEKYLKDKNENSGDKTFYLNENNENFSFKFYLKPSFVINSVRLNSPAYLAGVREGDKIVSINKRKAHTFTIQKINDLFQSEEGKRIKLEVEREGKIIEFEFFLKKIL